MRFSPIGDRSFLILPGPAQAKPSKRHSGQDEAPKFRLLVRGIVPNGKPAHGPSNHVRPRQSRGMGTRSAVHDVARLRMLPVLPPPHAQRRAIQGSDAHLSHLRGECVLLELQRRMVPVRRRSHDATSRRGEISLLETHSRPVPVVKAVSSSVFQRTAGISPSPGSSSKVARQRTRTRVVPGINNKLWLIVEIHLHM